MVSVTIFLNGTINLPMNSGNCSGVIINYDFLTPQPFSLISFRILTAIAGSISFEQSPPSFFHSHDLTQYFPDLVAKFPNRC